MAAQGPTDRRSPAAARGSPAADHWLPAAARRLLLGAAVSAAVFLALLPWSGAPTAWDRALEAWLADHVGHRADVETWLSWPGSLGTALGLSVVVLAVRRLPAAPWLAAAWAWRGMAEALKRVVERTRPPGAGTESFAFPSGHATSAAVVLVVATALLLGNAPARARRTAWIVVLFLVALTGIGRVVGGAHWTTDVLAGWAFGAAGALALLAFRARFDAASAKAKSTDPS